MGRWASYPIALKHAAPFLQFRQWSLAIWNSPRCPDLKKIEEQIVIFNKHSVYCVQNVKMVSSVSWWNTAWETVFVQKQNKAMRVPLTVLIPLLIFLKNKICNNAVVAKQLPLTLVQFVKGGTTCKWQLSSFNVFFQLEHMMCNAAWLAAQWSIIEFFIWSIISFLVCRRSLSIKYG